MQAGRPCASAPILWIEPTTAPSAIVPSARTSAEWRRFSSNSVAPGAMRPASTMAEKATRGSERRLGVAAMASGGSGSVAAMRARAALA